MLMSDGLIGAASILTKTSLAPMGGRSTSSNLVTKNYSYSFRGGLVNQPIIFPLPKHEVSHFAERSALALLVILDQGSLFALLAPLSKFHRNKY